MPLLQPEVAPRGPAESGVAPQDAYEDPYDDPYDTEPEIDLFTPRSPAEDQWFDDEAGPVVRLFSVTRGRAARPVDEGLFDLISLVRATDDDGRADHGPALDATHHALLALCRDEPLIAGESAPHTHRAPENSGVRGHRLARTAPVRHIFAMWTTVEMWNTRERPRP